MPEPDYISEQLAACYENIVRNLSQLSSGKLATRFLQIAWTNGIALPPDLAPHVIRALSRNPANSKHITQLLRLYPTTVMTYEVYARYISRVSSTAPVVAMATLDLMLRKGLVVRRRLVQNLMTGISQCTDVPESRAFRYLTRVLRVSSDAGIEVDRVVLASLLRVVLVRQGLGAATSRISWLLRMSARLDRREGQSWPGRHETLVGILRKWHVHERTRGASSGSLRPKQLRQEIDAMALRDTVRKTGNEKSRDARRRGRLRSLD